jgi:hypothetical protein
MRETLSDEVSVELLCDIAKAAPQRLEWRGRSYVIAQTGLHHTYRKGRALIHVFSVTDGSTFFRLELNSETLRWLLKEVADGQPD